MIKKIWLKFYYFGNNNKAKIDVLQKNIRDIEWNSIVSNVPERSKFLDVGCGAGYSMTLAESEKKCEVFGVDPDPSAHGVNRNWGNSSKDESLHTILKGNGEELPFAASSFDVVYSSHVLEHVNDETTFLREMKRVAKDDGVIIIGVPTASMALINMISQILFLSHHRFCNYFLSRLGFAAFPKISLKHFVLMFSHSFTEKTILYDLKHYRVKNWSNIISQEFDIVNTILPAIYPYPDFIQFFKLKKNKKFSSSVFFICRKRDSIIK